jgi:hypothetical protein
MNVGIKQKIRVEQVHGTLVLLGFWKREQDHSNWRCIQVVMVIGPLAAQNTDNYGCIKRPLSAGICQPSAMSRDRVPASRSWYDRYAASFRQGDVIGMLPKLASTEILTALSRMI